MITFCGLHFFNWISNSSLKVCGKPLDCGEHSCEMVCHAGSCGECPRAGARTCPCGKTNVILPCTEDTPTCEDTCKKDLACGRHYCSQRCHYGPCQTCLQVIFLRTRLSYSLATSLSFLHDWKNLQISNSGLLLTIMIDPRFATGFYS